MGREALLHRSVLLLQQEAGPALSRWHVLWILPRRAESRQAARRPGKSQIRESKLQRRRPVLLGRQNSRVEPGHEQLSAPALSYFEARNARHLANLFRQHQ